MPVRAKRFACTEEAERPLQAKVVMSLEPPIAHPKGSPPAARGRFRDRDEGSVYGNGPSALPWKKTLNRSLPPRVQQNNPDRMITVQRNPPQLSFSS